MYELLMDMSVDRLGQVYEALPDSVRVALDTPIGQALNSRPAKVAKRPLGMRMKALRSWIMRKRDESLAGDIVRAYLLVSRKELVIEFLDATGVAHEKGQIDDEAGDPDEMRVASAIESMREDHSDEDVLLYLQIAVQQWPESAGVTDARDELAAVLGKG